MNRPLVLIILDGWGYSSAIEGNAIAAARKPTYDHLLSTYPNSLIYTSGPSVGLPEGQMGNSEVGHLNIGAGRVVRMDITRIDAMIAADEFSSDPAIAQAMQQYGLIVADIGGPMYVTGASASVNASNAINYTEGNNTANAPSTAWGQVSVDALDAINFTTKTTLTINGFAGDDTTNINNPNTPTGLTGITVNGGDPTASDTLIVNGRFRASPAGLSRMMRLFGLSILNNTGRSFGPSLLFDREFTGKAAGLLRRLFAARGLNPVD